MDPSETEPIETATAEGMGDAPQPGQQRLDRSHHPSLGRHLRSAIRTGHYYSCSPDPRISIDWQL